MGFLDNLKAKLGPAKDKVGDLAQQHGGKIEQGLDKAARTVDQKTKGKYSDKIDSGTRKAKEAVDKLGNKDGGAPGASGTPGTPGTPGAPGAPGTPGASVTPGNTPPPPPAS
ncbi:MULTISPECIES: Rv0909 family putative TA system antitoxin [Streptomyces]|uniref:Rv0909 family putative TA system antitoxin n=1 Tax=Streptomyces TaxID=1883 RepID=UPI001361ABE6|nr:antitoxin [Streptomyces sp. SID724]